MLVVFLAGSAIAAGQDRNEKKINRIQRKIEKQNEKLQQLTGREYHAFEQVAPNMDREEIVRIREKAMAQAEISREQVREAMEQQREAMQAQREVMRDQKRELEERMMVLREKDLAGLGQLKEKQQMELEVLKNLDGKNFHYYYKTPNWKSGSGEPFVIEAPDVNVDIPAFKGNFYHFSNDSQNNLSINKTLTDESGTADFNYEVKDGAKSISVGVNGAIDAGKVKIVIKRPDGEVYNEYSLSSLASVNWKQTIKFEDQEVSEYVGKWTVTVTAEQAKGTYGIEIGGR